MSICDSSLEFTLKPRVLAHINASRLSPVVSPCRNIFTRSDHKESTSARISVPSWSRYPEDPSIKIPWSAHMRISWIATCGIPLERSTMTVPSSSDTGRNSRVSSRISDAFRLLTRTWTSAMGSRSGGATTRTNTWSSGLCSRRYLASARLSAEASALSKTTIKGRRSVWSAKN